MLGCTASSIGGIVLEGPRHLRLMLSLLAAFARHIADGMSMHDFAHRLAVLKRGTALPTDAAAVA